jgi:RecB family endonuclease NucS
MLPGVGFTLARRLLQHFGSLARLLTAGPDALSQVPGVGRRTAAAIAELLLREYCAVDSEADLEEVLAERAELLLEGSATLLARQHLFRDREGRRLVADLIFVDDAQQTVFLVEIKRGALRQEDVRQLAAYLDAAEHSPLLRAYVERGYAMRGLLAAPESQLTGTEDERVAVRLVEAEEAAAELMRRRLRRLGEADGEA